MIEQFHYKGNFEFYYYPTNQGKLIKDFLKDVATDKLKKEAKKRPWNSYSSQEKRAAINAAGVLFHYLSPEELAKYLDPDYLKEEMSEDDTVCSSVDLYHVMNLVAKLVLHPGYFNIKHDLACRILKDGFDTIYFEDSM